METHKQEKKGTQTSPENKNPKQEASPSSTSSSPSHEFSFTISLQPLSSSSSHPKPNPNLRTTTKTNPFAVDLSPADEIFFHGHLLPLHLLSHLPVSPRTSTGSLDGFALPVRDISHDKPTLSHNTTNNNNNINIEPKNGCAVARNTGDIISNGYKSDPVCENRVKNRPIKSFSLFNLSKWRKGFEGKDRVDEEQQEEEEDEEDKAKQQQQQKKKLVSLDLSHALKKYIRMLFHRRENGTQFMRRRQAYSFSSASTVLTNSRSRHSNNGYNINNSKKDSIGRRRRGEFSAPASMRTSPTNSGHLRGISTTSSSISCSTSSDSTMEELQAAIQAAIAHCKNSIAVQDRDNNKVNN